MGVRAVYALRTGFAEAPPWLVGGRPRSGAVCVPFFAFAVVLDDGFLLVDTGSGTDSRLAQVATWLGWLHVGASESLSERLSQLGLKAADCRGVVLTHLDVDHTGGLAQVARVPVWVTQEALLGMARPSRKDAYMGRYESARLAVCERIHGFELARHSNLELGELCRGYDMLGDGSVVAVGLPGHAPGHVGVVVRLPSRGRVLLCGDAAFTADQAAGRESCGLMPRVVASDYGQVKRTLALLAELVATGVRVVPSHDPHLGELAAAEPYRLEA